MIKIKKDQGQDLDLDHQNQDPGKRENLEDQDLTRIQAILGQGPAKGGVLKNQGENGKVNIKNHQNRVQVKANGPRENYFQTFTNVQ